MTSAAPVIDAPKVEVIAPAILGDLVSDWRQLWRAVPGASPFLSPAWLGAWAEVYAPGRTWAAALRDEGQLVALLPVFVWDKALLLAGTGPSDQGGVLILPGYDRWAGPLLQAAAGMVEEDFDRIDLQQLSPASSLANAELPGWCSRREAGVCCVTLSLDPLAMPKKMSDEWHYVVRRLKREGGSIDVVGPGEIAGGIAELERLHRLRWRTRGEGGMLADPLLSKLVATTAPRLAADGLLRLYRLRLGGRAIAVMLMLRSRDTASYYLSGFDPTYARFSPGTALIGSAIADAVEQGAITFDFLRGGEAYKYRWGAEDRELVRRILTR